MDRVATTITPNQLSSSYYCRVAFNGEGGDLITNHSFPGKRKEKPSPSAPIDSKDGDTHQYKVVIPNCVVGNNDCYGKSFLATLLSSMLNPRIKEVWFLSGGKLHFHNCRRDFLVMQEFKKIASEDELVEIINNFLQNHTTERDYAEHGKELKKELTGLLNKSPDSSDVRQWLERIANNMDLVWLEKNHKAFAIALRVFFNQQETPDKFNFAKWKALSPSEKLQFIQSCDESEETELKLKFKLIGWKDWVAQVDKLEEPERNLYLAKKEEIISLCDRKLEAVEKSKASEDSKLMRDSNVLDIFEALQINITNFIGENGRNVLGKLLENKFKLTDHHNDFLKKAIEIYREHSKNYIIEESIVIPLIAQLKGFDVIGYAGNIWPLIESVLVQYLLEGRNHKPLYFSEIKFYTFKSRNRFVRWVHRQAENRSVFNKHNKDECAMDSTVNDILDLFDAPAIPVLDIPDDDIETLMQIDKRHNMPFSLHHFIDVDAVKIILFSTLFGRGDISDKELIKDHTKLISDCARMITRSPIWLQKKQEIEQKRQEKESTQEKEENFIKETAKSLHHVQVKFRAALESWRDSEIWITLPLWKDIELFNERTSINTTVKQFDISMYLIFKLVKYIFNELSDRFSILSQCVIRGRDTTNENMGFRAQCEYYRRQIVSIAVINLIRSYLPLILDDDGISEENKYRIMVTYSVKIEEAIVRYELSSESEKVEEDINSIISQMATNTLFRQAQILQPMIPVISTINGESPSQVKMERIEHSSHFFWTAYHSDLEGYPEDSVMRFRRNAHQMGVLMTINYFRKQYPDFDLYQFDEKASDHLQHFGHTLAESQVSNLLRSENKMNDEQRFTQSLQILKIALTAWFKNHLNRNIEDIKVAMSILKITNAYIDVFQNSSNDSSTEQIREELGDFKAVAYKTGCDFFTTFFQSKDRNTDDLKQIYVETYSTQETISIPSK